MPHSTQRKRNALEGEMRPEFKLIRQALKFANLAAGEGICIDGIVAEDFLMDYSFETGFEDWDAIEDHVVAEITTKRNG